MKIKKEVTEIPESSVDTTPKDYQVECNQCMEEIQYTFDPLGEVSTDTIVDLDGYSIVCPNCGNKIEVDPKPLDLVVVKVDDVTDYGFFMELMDKNTARKCWFNAWKDEHGYWEYDYNQFQFNMDNEHDIIAKLFQQELNSYSGVIGDFVGEIAQEIKSGKRAKKETKSLTMRDRLKEAQSNKFVGRFDKLPSDKQPMSYEDWVGSEDYVSTLLDAYDVDTEEELADCNISENDVVNLYNDVYLANFEPDEDKQDWYYYEIHFDFTEESGKDSDGYSKFFKSKENVDGDYSEEVWNLAISEDVIGDEDDFYDVDYTQQIDKEEYERATRIKTESKKIKTEDITSSEFNLYIKPEELSDVNISSLLFDSDTTIASYKEGNYELSLMVRGDIRILDNEADAVYKNYQQFPEDLKQLIKSGELGYQDFNDRYVVDMNNWFEWFLDVADSGDVVDNVWYDVADIEGMLNKPTPEENETELEVIMKDLFDDIVGQLNEGKKIESKTMKKENAPADVIEYFGMQDNTDEEYKNNVAKEYKTLRAKYPDKEMILNGDFGTYLGTEKATPVEKGEYITVYNKVEENVNIEISEDGKEVEVTTDDHEEVEVKDETPEDDDKNEEDTENNESENEEDTEEDSIDDISLSEGTNKKSAEKIAGSMVKKEETTNSVLDVNKIAKFLKQAIEDLTTTDYTCTWYDLDEDLAIFVGWSGGFDPKDTDCIHSKEDPTYAICVEIASTYDYMKTDLDYLTMPYNEEDGEVYDTQSALSKEANFEQEAIYLIDEYKEIRKAVDNGELMLESKKSKKVTESKTSDMDTVDIIMELEGGELTIEDVDDWDTVKALARDLAGSQGFYGRLLRDMDDAEEEYGGVDYLPFPIIL